MAGLDVREAFLDHCAPSLATTLADLARARTAHASTALGAGAGGACAAVLVPLLLTAAYHSKSDIPAQAAAAGAALPGLRLRRAATLGPHPLLIAGLERRLAEALPDTTSRAQTSVVLAAAGTTDPQANASVADMAARWQATGRWRRVVAAYAGAASPPVAEAIRELRTISGPVVVATYLLAPGYFAGKIEAQAMAAGAGAVSAPLGAIPEVAEVILERYQQAGVFPYPKGQFPVAKPSVTTR
jgi:sirohydrochlorin ferrochelatase